MAVGEQNRRERNYQVRFRAAQHHSSGAIKLNYRLPFGEINYSEILSELAAEALLPCGCSRTVIGRAYNVE